MTRLVVKNGHQMDTYHNELGLCVENMLNILESIFEHNKEGLCDRLREKESSL